MPRPQGTVQTAMQHFDDCALVRKDRTHQGGGRWVVHNEMGKRNRRMKPMTDAVEGQFKTFGMQGEGGVDPSLEESGTTAQPSLIDVLKEDSSEQVSFPAYPCPAHRREVSRTAFSRFARRDIALREVEEGGWIDTTVLAARPETELSIRMRATEIEILAPAHAGESMGKSGADDMR
ncbi:hypothetical protein B0H19DRAFT_1071584 [Mycena capillaripes]|nr:hypothetical protein B0H19DRAFT_1071584 [Mycena capillaripes]